MGQKLKWGRFSVLSFSIGCSFVLSLILSEVSVLQKLELLLQDQLLLWQQSKTSPTDEIALIGLRERDLIGIEAEQTRYAALVRRILEEGKASVVVLNLLDNWVNEISASENVRLRQLVENYSDQIVLVTPTPSVNRASVTEIETYHHLLPPLVGDQFQSVYDVMTIQGFYEFDYTPPTLESSARLAHLQGRFEYNHPTLGQTQGQFYSALALAWLKHQQQMSGELERKGFLTSEFAQPEWPIQIPFLGDMKHFPSWQFQDICLQVKNNRCSQPLNPKITQQMREKIVVIGFVAPETNTKALLSVPSPTGEPMPGLVIQGNILASLISQEVYQIPPRWVVQGVIFIGAIALGYLLNRRFQHHPQQRCRFIALLLLTTFGLYTSFAFIFEAQQLVLPLLLPNLTWLLTSVVIQGWLTYRAQQILIMQQQYEISQLKSAESKAIVLQTRKLLHRIASGIHEGPLQDLRLVMDKLELELPTTPDHVLDQLSEVGQSIRHYLQNIRSMAEQLDVTPELRQGLVFGIRHHIEQLQTMGKLTLTVEDQMQPLAETPFNSQWLDAREDIFMFFREAMINIIKHAQPPHGQARQVIISLRVEESECTLMIENDGELAVMPALASSVGYGTKIMEMVARELPGGRWQALIPPTGGYRVQLRWQHSVMTDAAWE